MNPYREPQKPTSRLKQFFVNRARVSPLTVFLAAVLIAGITLAATPALRVNGLKFGSADNTIYLTAYGCKLDGVTDDTTCWQNAAAATSVGTKLIAPAGNSLVTDTITIANNYVHVEGSGTYATRITFNPASAKPLFKVTQGATSTYGFSANNLLIIGGGVQTKTAFDLYDVRTANLEDIWIYSGWTGGSSIGIRTRGREMVSMSRITIYADRPLIFSANPNNASIGADHYHLEDMFLAPTPGGGFKAWEIEDGVPVFNLVTSGYNSIIVDKYGLYWSDTTTVTASQNISLNNIRCEQAQDATGYCIYVDSNTASPIQNMGLHNVAVAVAQNGMLIKGVTDLTIDHGMFPANDAAKLHLSVDRIKHLKVSNTLWQINTLVSLTGLTQIWGMPKDQSAQAMPPDGWWADTTTATNQTQQLSPIITVLKNLFKHTDAANTNPFTFDTTNAFSGGNSLMEWKNAGTRKAFIDNNGGFMSADGVFDASSTTASLGAFLATGVTVGKSTITTTIAGAQAVHRTTVADLAYTTVAGDYLVAYTSLSAGRIVTIQCTTAGREFVIKNESAGAFALTITPASGTCDGAASCATTAAGHAPAVRVYADGTNCHTY